MIDYRSYTRNTQAERYDDVIPRVILKKCNFDNSSMNFYTNLFITERVFHRDNFPTVLSDHTTYLKFPDKQRRYLRGIICHDIQNKTGAIPFENTSDLYEFIMILNPYQLTLKSSK